MIIYEKKQSDKVYNFESIEKIKKAIKNMLKRLLIGTFFMNTPITYFTKKFVYNFFCCIHFMYHYYPFF